MHRLIARLGSGLLFAVFCVSSGLGGCRKRSEPEATSAQPVQAQSPVIKTAPLTQPATASCGFEWLDADKHAAIWSEVASNFHQELLPDQGANESNPDAYAVKKITRLARCGDGLFVAIEQTTGRKEDEEWNRLFELYNFNLSTKQKLEITAKWPFWLWKFRQLAKFEDGASPDIVFECYSCTECEPAVILNALRFDAKEQKWGLREWANGEQGITIGDAAVDVGGSVEEYQMLSGIGDFDGSGHDEVVVWTHYRDVDEKDPNKVLPAVAEVSIFSYQGGRPVQKDIKDPSGTNRIKKKLCGMNPQEDACKDLGSQLPISHQQ